VNLDKEGAVLRTRGELGLAIRLARGKVECVEHGRIGQLEGGVCCFRAGCLRFGGAYLGIVTATEHAPRELGGVHHWRDHIPVFSRLTITLAVRRTWRSCTRCGKTRSLAACRGRTWVVARFRRSSRPLTTSCGKKKIRF